MHLHQVSHFVAIVESGSIRAAARALGLSQPTLTKSLRSLETQLQSVLFQRTARGIVLTPHGQALLPRARAMLGELRSAREDLERLSGRQVDVVRAGVASIVGAWLVPRVLARYRQQHRRTSLRLQEGTQETLLPLLRESALDFAVCLRLDSESVGGFAVKPLARFRLAVVGRKGHPLRGARTLEELAKAHWIMTRPRGKGGMLEEAFKAQRLGPPEDATECDSHAIKISMLATSDALGLVARPMLGEPAVNALLEEIPLARPLPLMTLALYTRADAQLNDAGLAFTRAVAAECRNLLRLNP